MSFLLRAALVIGALSYLAATRDPSGPTGVGSLARPIASARDETQPAPVTGSTLVATVGSASALWRALPADARQRLAQDAVAEIGRHVGSATASHDTLADVDRKAAWRGAEGR